MIGEHIIMMEASSTVTFWGFFVNTDMQDVGTVIIIKPFKPFAPDHTFNVTVSNEQKLLL